MRHARDQSTRIAGNPAVGARIWGGQPCEAAAMSGLFMRKDAFCVQAGGKLCAWPLCRVTPGLMKAARTPVCGRHTSGRGVFKEIATPQLLDACTR